MEQYEESTQAENGAEGFMGNGNCGIAEVSRLEGSTCGLEIGSLKTHLEGTIYISGSSCLRGEGCRWE